MEFATAVSSDVPELCALLAFLFAQEAEFAPDEVVQRQALEWIICRPEFGHVLVAKEAGQVLAMVSLLYTISTALGGRVALLEDMVVSPGARGSGVGSGLLKHAVEFACSQGCRRMTLLTDGDNLAAQHFYQRYGFQRSNMIPLRLPLLHGET